MSNKQSQIKLVALGFAVFLDTECIKGLRGWHLIDALDDNQGYEFELDELYDYWTSRLINEDATETT